MQKSTKSYASLVGKIALGVLIFLVLLPEILRLILISVVSDYGIGALEVDDIDLNLFKGAAGIEKINLQQAEKVTLELNEVRINVSWLKLLLGEFHIENLVVEGLRFDVTELEDGRWEVVIPMPVAPADKDIAKEEAQAINLQQLLKKEYPKLLIRKAALKNVNVNVKSVVVSGHLNIDELKINNLSSWQDSAAEIELQASWQQAPISLSMRLSPWQNEPEIEAQLSLKALALADFRPVPGEKLQGKISTDSQLSLRLLPEGIAITFDSDSLLANLEAGFNNISLNNEQLSLNSVGELLLSADAKSLQSMQSKTKLSAKNLQVTETNQQRKLLSWSTLSLSDLSVNETMSAGFESLEVQDLAVIEGDKTQGGFITRQLVVQQLAWSEQHLLTINSVVLNGGHYDVVLNKQGQLEMKNILARVISELELDKDATLEAPESESVASEETAQAQTKVSDETENKKETEDKKAQDPLLFSIKKIVVSEDTTITFVDLRFEKPVEQRLVIEQLELDNLDQQHPDKDTLLKLKGRVGEFGNINISGQLQPFASNISGQFSGELDAIELPGLSPYSEAYLGYHFSRGHYDHKFEVSIASEEVDVKNTLQLRQLLVKPVQSKQPQPLEKQLDVPLGLALNMLRDSDDNIKLKVPVKGRLDQPNIDISQIINHALAKALKNGATSYLKYALQPYGAVFMAADFVGDQINAVRLDPMPFEAGSDSVPEGTEYIDKLSGLLQDRPNLHLSLCGRSNAADRQALLALQESTTKITAQKNTESTADADNQKVAMVKKDASVQISTAELIKLADQRAKNLKRAFIEKGVKANRVLLCDAEFKDEGPSGVALQM